MYNFFLLNEALDTNSVAELEIGISNLNTLLVNRDNNTDVFMLHNSLWMYHNGLGTINDFFFSVVSPEVQRLVPKLFGSFTESNNYINSEALFDDFFPNNCNAFTGINFSNVSISDSRQIKNLQKFNNFKRTCTASNNYNSVQEFWENRHLLFASLLFCENVFQQIQHLSINDDRFKLIVEKLNRINSFTQKWINGQFDYKSCGLNISPDTPKRIQNTLKLRTFTCPDLGNRVFSLHVKWYCGSEPFRLYFFPDNHNRKVYIGYIGDKDGIGF